VDGVLVEEKGAPDWHFKQEKGENLLKGSRPVNSRWVPRKGFKKKGRGGQN